MDMQTYETVLLSLKLIMSTAVFIMLIVIGKKDIKGNVLKEYEELKNKNRNKLAKNPRKKFAAEIMDDTMLATGIKYRMGDRFTPFDYTAFRIAICIGFGLVGVIIGPAYLVVGVLLGLFGVPYYFNHENEYDNGEMLDDIAQMYSTVALQAKNGIHISKIIYECYMVCQQPRLKKALLEMATDIDKFGSVEDAAKRFRAKFTNAHIDTFAKTLEQATETGNAVQMFEDIQANIDGIQEAINIRKESQVKMQSFVWQTIIFCSIILFVVYIVSMMFGDAMTLLG